jgi:hypothetical protein
MPKILDLGYALALDISDSVALIHAEQDRILSLAPEDFPRPGWYGATPAFAAAREEWERTDGRTWDQLVEAGER